MCAAMQCACCYQYPPPRYPFFSNRPISEPLRTKIYFPDSQVDISGVCLLEGTERRFNQDGSLLLRLFPTTTRLAPHQQFGTSNQAPASNTLVNRCEVRPQPTSNSRQVSVIKRTTTVAPREEPVGESRTGSKRASNLESPDERTYPTSKRLKTPEPLEEPTSHAVHDVTEVMCTKSPILPDKNALEGITATRREASPVSRNERISPGNICTPSSPVPLGEDLSQSGDIPREGTTKQIASDRHCFQGVITRVEPPRPSTSRKLDDAIHFKHDIINSPDSVRPLSVIKQIKQTPMAQNIKIPPFSYAPATVQQVERVYQQASVRTTVQQVERVYQQDPVRTTIHQVERIYQEDPMRATKKGLKVRRKKNREKKPRKNYNRINAWNGPSYTDLITNAITSAADRKMIVAEIYDWLIQHVPYFNERQDCESSQGWKNAVRHTLSLRRRFVRVPKPHSTTPWYNSYWTINERIIGDTSDLPPRRRKIDNRRKKKPSKNIDCAECIAVNTDIDPLETSSLSSS